MYNLIFTTRFNKDIKLCKKRNYNFSELKSVIEILESKGNLPLKYKSHILSGNYSKHWECHIKPDWLLIWLLDEASKEITLVRTGTHSDLF
ncbi:type II toxin-antitoxin system YafQ family toxin [Flavobacterium sp.]|uniref:type II toxin-antitoxin system YafQ family toxin n=1 Tax=Flavobacterium sp. TaxID=239 RepID=UPI00374FEF1B